MGEGRSLAETPTWSVATVTTFMVFICFLVERAIHRLGKWLRRTKRKAMLAALEKIRDSLMLLGLISLMLSQTARWISEICVPSSLFSSRFYICTEGDFDAAAAAAESDANRNYFAGTIFGVSPHGCAKVTSATGVGEGKMLGYKLDQNQWLQDQSTSSKKRRPFKIYRRGETVKDDQSSEEGRGQHPERADDDFWALA